MADSDSDNSSPEKDEGANEPYHARLRRTTKSPVLVILSSDSDNDCNLVEDDSNSQPSETDGETSVKVEKCSEDENSSRKEKQSTKKGETEETNQVEKSIANNENLKSKATVSLRRNSGQNNSLLKGETSKGAVPKSFRRNCPRWCNSYYKRKKILAQKSSKRPLRPSPRKYFDHLPNKKYVRKGGHYAISKKPHKRKSIDSNMQSDTPENQEEEEEEEHSEADPKSTSPSQKPLGDPVRRRGRPKVVPGQTLKKKRGRPKLSEAEILLRKKQRTRLFANQGIVKQVIAKRRGRPKASETEDVVRRKGRPRLQRNDMGEIIPSHGHMSAKARTFVQHLNCLNGAIRLPKCRECRKASYTRSNWDMTSSYCRFLEYRKLFAARSGTIHSDGFLQPSDSTEYDRRLWLPKLGEPPKDLTIDTAKELLIQVGDQFCNLVQQEKEALSLHIGAGKSMTWKKLVQGIREMCDVCDTTLFNIHWVCPKCGLAVCIDCYKVRKQGIIIEDEESQMRGRDDYMWMFCHNRQPHEQNKLIMAQMVPGDILWTMNDTMHKVREKWTIAAHCKCSRQANISPHKSSIDTGICKELLSNVSKSFTGVTYSKPFHKRRPLANELSHLNINIPNCGSKWLQGMSEDDASFESILEETFNSGSKSGRMPSYICHDVIIPVDDAFPVPVNENCNDIFKALSFSALMKGLEESEPKHNKNDVINTLKLFNSRYPQPSRGGEPLPLRIFTSIESDLPFKGIPHSWLCNGRLLLLHKPDHPRNIELFQEQWKRGQPIMVMAVDEKLDMSLWHPNGFCRDFGDIENDLVNCKTGSVIPNLPMKKFWQGFENFDKRMKDDSGEYMLLKLKDWPPGEDFSEKLPTRFHDLMKGLPLPEYTHRDGIFNLAGRLPSWFVRPDLGPKMYNAYGSALYPTKGTTNLHLDISDAVNVMVYVGIPHDGKDEDHIIEALKAIDEGGCDSLMRERVRSKGVRPGALWHIYDSRSVDKIRTFLTKVAIERGEKLEAHHDPIHDQSWYLDSELRRRLYVEYGVQGYAIAQCLGDAVFIPAGAPHQVRNLHSCVKVAEDFVSPENIAHCFKLTQEFRHLSDTHTNHEDKLQIKNIIYHVVKDALSHLLEEKDDFCSFLKDL